MIHDDGLPVGKLQIEMASGQPATVGCLALVARPGLWKCGCGRRVTGALLERPEVAALGRARAKVEPGNWASRRCLVAAGWPAGRRARRRGFPLLSGSDSLVEATGKGERLGESGYPVRHKARNASAPSEHQQRMQPSQHLECDPRLRKRGGGAYHGRYSLPSGRLGG